MLHEPPPQLEPEFSGLDEMIVRLPAESTWSGETVVLGLVAAVTAMMAGLLAPWLPGVVVAAMLGVAGASAVVAGVRASADRSPDHELRIGPGRLTIGEDVVFMADLVDVRWDCASPITTLVLRTRQGERRVVCARRGLRSARGVTRRQREWLQGLLLARADASTGVVPDALASLRGETARTLVEPPTS